MATSAYALQQAQISSDNKMGAASNASKKLMQQESRDAKIWNRFAGGYAKSPIKDEESYQKKIAMTREYFTPDTTVLEFACGTGGTSLLHAPYVKSIYAIDVSSEMIKIAKEKQREQDGTDNVTFEAMGIDRLNVPDESYDVVMGHSILHLLPQKDETIRKVHQLLKPNGVFVSSTICLAESAPSGLSWIAGPLASLGVIPRVHFFTKDELKESLVGAGFEIEKEFHPGKDKAVFYIARKK
jgi:ubiquinone/menaquinone biosynthesis C-methylase UbiE